MTISSPVRVVVADDHPAFRSGVASWLDQNPDVTVIAQAADGHEALRRAMESKPDVLVLDLEMPKMTGLEVIRALKREGSTTQVLVLSAHEKMEWVQAILDEGAAGYLSKVESLDAILEAVLGIHSGEVGWLSRRISRLYVQSARDPDRDILAETSEREIDVLQAIARGLSNKQIADELFIAESTVKKHANSIYAKLGVETRAQTIALMWRNGLVDGAEG
ncbi:MAG: response regulator transcription factor [Rhodothermales bacterium]